MKTQFLHEAHNRQDKTKKIPYRKEIFESPRRGQARTESERLLAKVSAREKYIKELRKCRYVFNQMAFRFGWSLEVFAKKNNLSFDDDSTEVHFEKVRNAAERDIENLSALIKTAPIRDCGMYYKFYFEIPSMECQIYLGKSTQPLSN